ncbi:MAG: VOC family protein [Actinobacteria bacterium]|nr:VOC family protein [Actinomycetota bacterium]
MTLVVIRVGDLETSRRFYEQLGLRFRSEQHGAGPRHLSSEIGGTVLELYPRGTGPSTEGVRLGFVVDDLDAVSSRCQANVVQDGERDGSRIVVVRDPDGHKIELTDR